MFRNASVADQRPNPRRIVLSSKLVSENRSLHHCRCTKMVVNHK